MEISINGARILAVFENVPLLGTVRLTQTVAMSWVVMIIISALCIWLGSNLKVTGISRKQAVAEMAVTSLVKFVHNNMGTGFDHYIPLVGTIFITSVISNTISVLGFWSPTADLMTELGWALVVFVIITYHKIKAAGFGAYLKGFLDPLFVLAPINVMAECFTPISMACRHFGNILSGTVISALIYGALTAATHGLLGLLGSSLIAAVIVSAAGVVLAVVMKKMGKTVYFVLGIILTLLGVFALLHNAGGFLGEIPFLAIGIPAVTGAYFDWFGGCIQAFIFCTLTTLFIKQAAG
ncbi:MAG: F0F1 ATP synthase subunit A [Ruminococcaceae bacterium]|nr:F0F1 ATP synthase subunit A [Oscillospiraceae bacterium]